MIICNKSVRLETRVNCFIIISELQLDFERKKKIDMAIWQSLVLILSDPLHNGLVPTTD
jgi:hypothetical protein